MIVLDASVAIKTILSEDDSGAAVAIFRHVVCNAPDLIFSECANVVWKRFSRGEITRAFVDEASLLIESMNLYIAPSRLLLRRAMSISVELDHPTYDCFYLALAEQERVPLVTADKKLRDRVAGSHNKATSAEVILLADYETLRTP